MGEIVEDQRGWLVGMPFPLIAEAWARIVEDRKGVEVKPREFWKTRRLCEEVLRRYGIEHIGVQICVALSVPPGKGCGTSTRSMLLGALATADCVGVVSDTEWLCSTMASIEPCDALASAGSLLIWDFTRGLALSEEYPLPHGAYVAAYPRSRSLETDLVDRNRPDYSARERATLEELFDKLPGVLASRSLEALGAVASISAEINDVYFPKPELRALRTLRKRGEVLGYWVAHSGTVVGVMALPHRLDTTFSNLLMALGDGYEVYGFTYDASTDGVPFLLGCRRRLLHVST